ncbi:MAG TPA: tetratricopeptide repeat protein [Candidatus Limnocylindrales bacterium]|nr:tetratricopeptide repeat protein [Candidatus Limnocylindrales bacterium]
MQDQDTVEKLLQCAREARGDHRPDDARRDLVEAVRLCREAGERKLLAAALTALGQVERDLGRRAEALRLYQEAAELYRGMDQPLRLAHTIRHVGDIHGEMKQFEQAEPFYAEALAIYRAHPEAAKLDLANALRGYALQREGVGESQQAAAMWREAGELYAACGVEAGVKESERRVARLRQHN